VGHRVTITDILETGNNVLFGLDDGTVKNHGIIPAHVKIMFPEISVGVVDRQGMPTDQKPRYIERCASPVNAVDIHRRTPGIVDIDVTAY